MSKKKAFSGSTMTLKDFHGGSIPSDLPLPSAPGVTTRPADRAGFDRHAPWGNPMGRSDHRLIRPGSSPTAKNFDGKTPFLTHPTRIGRTFDEDERKPLDGSSVPRRTVSDESIYAPAIRVELKPDSYSARFAEATNMGGSSGRQGSTPGFPLSSAGTASTYAGRASEATHVGVSSQKLGGNSNSAVTGPHPNVWTARKEVVSSTEPLPLACAGPTAFSKLAHASALEKVSSGRWQSKQPIHHQAEVEVIHHSEMECGLQFKGTNSYMYSGMDRLIGREHFDETLAKHVDGGLTIEDGIHCGGKEFPGYERVRSPLHFEAKERNPSLSCSGVPLTESDGYDWFGLQPLLTSEATERPKLKLIPRSKPFESLEPPLVVDYKQPTEIGHVEAAAKSHADVTSTIQGLTNTESRNVLSERPKLNLKPRSQPLEQFKESILKDRNTLFGGARPRELVLKERGIDEVADDHVADQVLNRVKYDVYKTEASSGRTVPARHTEKVENLPLDHRIIKNNEKDHRVDVERADMQRRNWRNENRRNNREPEKQQHQQPLQERDHSPDTWHRQKKSASPDPSGVRYGKVASAVELAQAFSKSISDPKTADRVSGLRGLPSQFQVPFSRLVGQTSRRQINGY